MPRQRPLSSLLTPSKHLINEVNIELGINFAQALTKSPFYFFVSTLSQITKDVVEAHCIGYSALSKVMDCHVDCEMEQLFRSTYVTSYDFKS
jgi:hypothetical protein